MLIVVFKEMLPIGEFYVTYYYNNLSMKNMVLKIC